MCLLENTKCTLVLGGATGIGKATAELLVRRGEAVVLASRRADVLALAAAELQPLGGNVDMLVLDLANPESVQNFAATIAAGRYKLTGLVNAAGVFLPRPFLAHEPADYDVYHDINRGLFFVTPAVARSMALRGHGGAIVNIGSMWAKQAIAATPSSAYSMAKAALHAFTQHLAMELAAHQIRVNAVSPAVVETPIYEGFIDKSAVHSALQGFNSLGVDLSLT